MNDKEKLSAAISALIQLEGVPVRFDLHEPIRVLQEQLGQQIVEIEAEEMLEQSIVHPMATAPKDRVICMEFNGQYGGLWHVFWYGGLWNNNGRQPSGEPIGWFEISPDDGVVPVRRLAKQ